MNGKKQLRLKTWPYSPTSHQPEDIFLPSLFTIEEKPLPLSTIPSTLEPRDGELLYISSLPILISIDSYNLSPMDTIAGKEISESATAERGRALDVTNLYVWKKGEDLLSKEELEIEERQATEYTVHSYTNIWLSAIHSTETPTGRNFELWHGFYFIQDDKETGSPQEDPKAMEITYQRSTDSNFLRLVLTDVVDPKTQNVILPESSLLYEINGAGCTETAHHT